jgi:hypothetical protein
MSIESRLGRIEQQLDREQGAGPFILVLRAGPAADEAAEAAYQARLRERIADVRRRYPNDKFRLIPA